MGSLAADIEPTTQLPTQYVGLKTNAKRMHDTLQESCQWGCTPDGGMNRLTLNDDDRKVREWFVAETKRCGCEVTVDAMGNIFAVRPGLNNALPPVAIGSHLDTQPTGGHYDGILGVTSGLEVLRTLHDAGVTTYAPLAVVDWTNEEGARFPPAMLSSGVWAGAFTTDYGHSRTDLADPSITLGAELERIGFRGATPCSFEARPLSAHFEVHIEQGPVLDEAGEAVAVVRGVQSMRWYNIDVTGREAHTGTTPMDRRSDALLGAAQMIVAVNEFVTGAGNPLAERQARATVAVVHSSPQSINTIAGRVHLALDIRAPSDADVEAVEELCRKRFAEIAASHGLSVTIDHFWSSPALHFDPVMVQCVRASAGSIGCHMELVSGAGHDSCYTSQRCPTAMVFARCRDGISHNPAEYTSPKDCAAAVEVLLGAYLRYDDYLRRTHEKA